MLWTVIIIVILFLFFITIGLKGIDKQQKQEVYQTFNVKDFKNEISFSVAGVHLQDYLYPVLNITKVNALINLIPEPDNKYDEDAIKVMCSDWHIGYVPAYSTVEIHQILKLNHLAYIDKRDVLGHIVISVKVLY